MLERPKKQSESTQIQAIASSNELTQQELQAVVAAGMKMEPVDAGK